ncbi:rab-like protein 3 [Coccinella septempunctata]|uniref:rab-like protein 3 n=1 Tax=Coccinella septempunctata TaxID=41139 RepID=UPI001D078581|nr:rab-like protein 3 [Coccinella septempunctata]
MNTSIKRVRIMVLGDSGVGKTSLVNLIAHNEPLKSPSWTIGCSVEVKLHEYKEGTRDQKTYFIEMWDIGGNNIGRNERHVFYNPCHGIILVHDFTNKKSEEHLNDWLQELINREGTNTSLTSITSFDEFDPENYMGSNQIPILVVGTKIDQASERKPCVRSFASQIGADEILLDNRQTRYLAAGTSNAVKLSRFFDRVIDYSNRSQYTNSVSSPIYSSKFVIPHQD